MLRQSVHLPVPPQRLYRTYLSSKLHGAAIGSTALIVPRVGGRFQAWGGYITGRNLQLVPNRRVVQSWRASDWAADAADSILILDFEKVPGGTVLHLTQVGVPRALAASLRKG